LTLAVAADPAAGKPPNIPPLSAAVASYNIGQYEPYPEKEPYVYVAATTALPLVDVEVQGLFGNSVIDVHGTGPGGPSLSADAGGYGEAADSLTWSYEVSGPSNQVLPMVISGVIDTDMSDPNTLGYAIASISGSHDGGNAVYAEACQGAFEDCYGATTYATGDVPFSIDFEVVSNTAQTVTIEAAGETFPGLGYSFASVDPLISISPSFGSTAGYELVLGPGTDDPGHGVPITALPEPAAWSLMSLGAVITGAALRVRPRRASA
jgi:hypothetical protein